MPRQRFLKDKRYKRTGFGDSSAGKTISRIAVIFLVVLIILTGAYFGAEYIIDRIILSSSEQFDEFISSGEYDKAMKFYRDHKESALNRSVFGFAGSKREAVLSDIEKKINDLILKAFIKVSDEGKAFSSEDVYLLESFSEITIREINKHYFSYLEECIRGECSESDAASVSAELKKVDIVGRIIAGYEDQIPRIIAFRESCLYIDNAFASGDYLKVLSEIHSGIDSNDGFIKEFLVRYLEEASSIIFKALINDVDVMMSRGKYYSAESLIIELQKYFPEKKEIGEKLEICSQFTSAELVEYTRPVEHIAIRPLISDRKFPFGKDQYALTAEDLMLTSSEFSKILEGLYSNNYILIDIESLVDNDGSFIPVMVPKGKKPLIL